jgi:hypothetical protein
MLVALPGLVSRRCELRRRPIINGEEAEAWAAKVRR